MICEKCIHNAVCKYGEARGDNGLYCTGEKCKQFDPDKEIPLKPRVDNDDWLHCRKCGETFSLTNGLHKRNNYCGNCGQKIDWSIKEETK